MRVILLLDGISNFVGFFNRVRHDAGKGLFGVPGAAGLRIPKPCHQVFQIFDAVTHPRFRLTSMMFGRFRICASSRASCSRLEISTVTRMVAVFSSLLVRVLRDNTSLRDDDSTWVMSRSRPERS